MKNYKEVGSFGRGAGTDNPYVVAFEPSFKMNQLEDGILPLSGKAGLTIKYIGQTPMSGFIKRPELWQFYRRVDFAVNRLFERELNPVSADGEASTPYVFKMGNGFTGKTPEQCLLEGMPEEQMLQQRAYMERNCTGKFAEQNRQGVAAIDRALEKFHDGTLGNSPATAVSFTVYDSGARYFSRRVPQPYKTEGWEMKIVCMFTDKNPWKIGWVSKTVTIQDNVIVAAENVITKTASLTTDEFLSGVEEAKELFSNIAASYTPAHLKYFSQHKDDWRN